MNRESKTSPPEDASVDDVRLPAEPSDPEQTCCAACRARLHSSARFCCECGTAQATPAEEDAAAIHSRFGGSSADLAELLSAGGHVVACPGCDALNKATAAYCGHCGQQLAVADASQQIAPTEDVPGTSETKDEQQQPVSPAASTPSVRRYGPAIALTALLCVEVALWLGRPPIAPANPAARGAASRSVPAAQPPEPAVSTASVEPAAPSPVAPPPAPVASGEAQKEASPPVSPGPAQERTPAHEGARKRSAKMPVLHAAAAPIAVDALYRQRATERCAEGLRGLMCREGLRRELCNGKWTQDARSGMEICRLNP